MGIGFSMWSAGGGGQKLQAALNPDSVKNSVPTGNSSAPNDTRNVLGGVAAIFGRRDDSNPFQDIGEMIKNAFGGEGLSTNREVRSRAVASMIQQGIQDGSIRRTMLDRGTDAQGYVNNIAAYYQLSPDVVRQTLMTANGTSTFSELQAKIASGDGINEVVGMDWTEDFQKAKYNGVWFDGGKAARARQAAAAQATGSYLDQLPFKTTEEEMRNGIFQIKYDNWVRERTAAMRNPGARNADGSYNPWPALEQLKTEIAEGYPEFSKNAHSSLEAGGLTPVYGAIPDTVNALYNAAEATLGIGTGSWKDAGWASLAILPVIGQGATASKYGIKTLEKARPALRMIEPAVEAGKKVFSGIKRYAGERLAFAKKGFFELKEKLGIYARQIETDKLGQIHYRSKISGKFLAYKTKVIYEDVSDFAKSNFYYYGNKIKASSAVQFATGVVEGVFMPDSEQIPITKNKPRETGRYLGGLVSQLW